MYCNPVFTYTWDEAGLKSDSPGGGYLGYKIISVELAIPIKGMGSILRKA